MKRSGVAAAAVRQMDKKGKTRRPSGLWKKQNGMLIVLWILVDPVCIVDLQLALKGRKDRKLDSVRD